MKKIDKISITKRGLLERKNKRDKLLSRLVKKKKKGQTLKSIKFDMTKDDNITDTTNNKEVQETTANKYKTIKFRI